MASVLIFDSGVGGLSIYQHVRRECPDADYILVCDNDAFPYGEKSEDELNSRVLDVMSSLVLKYQPDIAIVACNTASTVVLPLLRGKLSLPVVGVVPAIKPAAVITQTKNIGLLATPGTIRRRYTNELIEQFAPNCNIIKIGSLRLVELCEQKLHFNSVNLDVLKEELTPIIENVKCDTLVLACTHFPLIKQDISELFGSFGRDIALVDSGDGIARRVSYLLRELGLGLSSTDKEQGSPTRTAIFTGDVDTSSAFVVRLATEFGLEYNGTFRLGAE